MQVFESVPILRFVSFCLSHYLGKGWEKNKICVECCNGVPVSMEMLYIECMFDLWSYRRIYDRAVAATENVWNKCGNEKTVTERTSEKSEVY